MADFDNFIIERVYSPLTGFIGRQFGVDQWRLSIECLNGSKVFYLAGVAFTIAAKGMKDGIFVDLLAALLWLTVMQFVRQVAYRQAGSSMGRQSARLGESIFRYILVGLLPLSIYYIQSMANLCHTVSLICLISHLYFKACDMPPPRRTGRLAYQSG